MRPAEYARLCVIGGVAWPRCRPTPANLPADIVATAQSGAWAGTGAADMSSTRTCRMHQCELHPYLQHSRLMTAGPACTAVPGWDNPECVPASGSTLCFCSHKHSVLARRFAPSAVLLVNWWSANGPAKRMAHRPPSICSTCSWPQDRGQCQTHMQLMGCRGTTQA